MTQNSQPQASPQVLIIEDEQSAARMIGALCGELGLAVHPVRSGVEAVAWLSQQAAAQALPACVVLDLVLAESDGFQVGQQVRAQPWGAELPLVVVSGVYKQLPEEFATRVRPAAFLPKPFEPSKLRETIARLARVPVQGQPQGGGDFDLAKTHPPALLVDLLRQKANGALTIAKDTTVRRLVLQGGMVRFGQSNVRGETAGAAQVASGQLKQASFDRAVALARQQKIALHEALAAARVLTPEQLKAALKQQTTEVAVNGLGWTSGTGKFEPQTPEQVAQVPDARVSAVALILDWAKREVQPAAARAWLEQHTAARLSRSAELERELFSLKALWPGESVTALAASGRTLGEVLGRVKEAELPLLYALAVSGLLGVQEARPAGAQATSTPSAADEDRGKVFTPREHDARRFLFAERDRLKDADHYRLLGIERKADAAAIKQAYFAAARRFHSDTFSGVELGSARRVAEELFARVNEANAVLSSEKQRAEYDVYLERKEAGLPTDVGAILKAESTFQKGEAFFKAGKWEDAEVAFREALALNHAEAEFHAYLGMAIYRGRGRIADALPHVEKALELEARLKSGQIFLATLKDALGETDAAKKLLRKVLEQDPDDAEAKAELARIVKGSQAGQAKKPGLLGRLLKKN